MSFFDTTPLGRILNRFSKDVDVIDNVLPMTMRFWVMMFFNVVGVLVVISYSTPIFLSIALPIAIVYYFIQKFYVATSRQLKRIESVTRSPIYTHFSETITGQSTIRAYGEEKRWKFNKSRNIYNANPSLLPWKVYNGVGTSSWLQSDDVVSKHCCDSLAFRTLRNHWSCRCAVRLFVCGASTRIHSTISCGTVS